MEEQNINSPFVTEGGFTSQPIKPKHVSDKSWLMYNRFYNFAKEKGDKYPEIFATQAALESNWFNSPKGKNNYFGKKATVKEPHTLVNNSRYRNYPSMEQALDDRFNNYSTKYQNVNTADEAINILNKYPSDKNYTQELVPLMKTMGLNTTTPKQTSSSTDISQTSEPIIQEQPQVQPEITIEQPQQSLGPAQINSNYGADIKQQADQNIGNSVENINLTNPKNGFAFGGNINNILNKRQPQTDANSLNEFNVGGTHEQNPYGGIPLGKGVNGKLNTVEQDETSHMIKGKKFIFSNRITI